MLKAKRQHYIFLNLILIVASLINLNNVHAQSTENSSSLSNTAAPSASSVTTGGTNINYQTNNAYNNEVGFGPGIFCRTPTIYFGGNGGQARLNAFDPVQESGNLSESLAFNMGILYPFGSSALADCKTLVKTIARDREISSQLSMIKACHDLYNKGIKVNSQLYPLLSSCELYADYMKAKKQDKSSDTKEPTADVQLKLQPRTKRML